ncbi:MAG TPA: XdhC family protein, partial [Flavisolibacter sp.]
DLKRQVHRKTSAHQSGMICSGEQTVLLYQAGAKDLEAVENIIAALREYHGGTLMLTPDAIYFDAGPAPQHASFVQLSASEWEYTAAVGNTSFLHIIGGGHCSLALSRLIRTTGFHITVYDDRPGLLTMEQNDAAHERITLGDYTELKDRVPQGDNIYVVVMTFGYRSDDMALRALLHHRFRYLGLLGSRSKVEKMLVDYRREGIPEDLLSPIRTPAGLPINSRTPEEIAISIAAEIIQVKNVVI